MGGRRCGGGAGEAGIERFGVGQGLGVDQVDKVIVTGRRVERGGIRAEDASHRRSRLAGQGHIDDVAGGRLSSGTGPL